MGFDGHAITRTIISSRNRQIGGRFISADFDAADLLAFFWAAYICRLAMLYFEVLYGTSNRITVARLTLTC